MGEEKKRILEMLESGIITASEALTLLEALEKDTKTTDKKNIFEDLFNQGQKQWQQAGTSFQQPKDKLYQLFQTTFQKLKDFELPFGKVIEFSHTFQEDTFSPKRIKVEMANGNLTIKPWNEQGVKAECRVKVYGESLEDEAREAFLKNSIFYTRDEKFSFSIGLKLMKVDTVLYVPTSVIDEVVVKLFNGSFDIRDAEVKELDVKTANGKIEVKRSKVGEFEGETGNGQIYFIECEGKKVEANSFNGAIHIVGSVGYTEVQSFNGNLLCDIQSNKAHTVKAQAVSGNIEVYVPDHLALKGVLRTNLGSFELPEVGMKKIVEKDEVVQKLVRFESEQEAPECLTIEGETKTGTISIKTRVVRDTQLTLPDSE